MYNLFDVGDHVIVRDDIPDIANYADGNTLERFPAHFIPQHSRIYTVGSSFWRDNYDCVALYEIPGCTHNARSFRLAEQSEISDVGRRAVASFNKLPR